MYLLKKIIVLHCLIILVLISYSKANCLRNNTSNSDIYLPLVNNVSKVTTIEYAEGPVKALHTSWKLIICGDDDTVTPNDPTNPDVSKAVLIARTYGKGRVVSDSLGLELNDVYDNKRMMKNITLWLNQSHSKHFAFSTGHSENVDSIDNSGYYGLLLKSLGYTVKQIDFLSYENIKKVNILYVGNAWSSFTDQEIADVEFFVKNGGGLYLTGSGWTWIYYGPGSDQNANDINDYPMVKLSKPYQCTWQDGTFIDPTHNINNDEGVPFYYTFYPNGNCNYNIKDSDNDGVIDQWDKCPETPINSCIDNKGCSCAKTLIEKNDSVSKSKWKTYYSKIADSYSKLVIKIENLSNDVDLYVKQGQKPSFENFDCRPYKGGTRDEVCELSNNSEALWYFSVYGYNTGTYSISVTAIR